MLHSPEELPVPEIMTVTEATAYLQAAITVLGKGDGVHTYLAEGIRARAGSHRKEDGLPIPYEGVLNLNKTSNGESFRACWNERTGFLLLEHTIGQGTGDFIEVQHLTDEWTAAHYYKTTRKQGKTHKGLTTHTEAERANAEALFTTTAADFKLALETRLADRPDLVAGIEWNAGDISRKLEQKKRHRLAGTRVGRFIGAMLK